jgi:hypothetical protein
VTVNPVADSYVDASNASANFGTSTQVRIDGSPVVRTYLRFNVSGVNGTVTKATLKIWANSAQSTGYDAYTVADNTWGETTITNANAPVFGAKLGSSGKITASTWTSVDVTSAITGNGTYSFGISTTNSTAVSMSSREGANPPQLLVGVNGGPALVIPPVSQLPQAPSKPSGSPRGAIAPLLLIAWPFLLLWSLRWAPLPSYQPRPRTARMGSAGWSTRTSRAWRR